MTKVRRLVVVIGFLGIAAVLSTASKGQPGKKPAGLVTTPQLTPAKEVSQLAEATESRFSQPGIVTYQPIQGDLYFALQLQPKLDKAPDRPRDILVMMSTTATQGGTGWVASHQIAEGIIETAREFDRVSLWTVNEPKFTKNLTKDFLLPKVYEDGKRLREAMTQYRAKEMPAGNADLKNALEEGLKSFDSSKDRQRIFLFLGDGLSTHNPMTEDDRVAIANKMKARRIAFFTVPLGQRFNPNTLHGLANATGGAVLRTRVDEEKLVDALKRYEEAFAGPVLYDSKLTLPAELTGICPSVLPPLRGDSPTLVVGRMPKAPKQIDIEVTGAIDGRKGTVTVKATEPVQAPTLDNYFLVNMIDQWAKAKTYPAALRADRTLVHAYEATRLQHQEYLELGQVALSEGKYDAAAGMFKQARSLAPHDGQAAAGIKIVDRLKDGTLNKDIIKKQIEKRANKADQFKMVDGKMVWTRVDFVQLAQDDDKQLPPGVNPKQPGIANENLLKEHRDRQAVEEQKIANSVEEAIRQARRGLDKDPDGTIDYLRNLLNRVKDHPDLGAPVRDALGARLQAALQVSNADVKVIKMKKQNQAEAVAQAQANLVKEQERKNFEDRVDSQFRVYKNLMTVARFEERTKLEIMQAMVAIQDEARLKGHAVPMATKATYDIAHAALPLQTYNTLIRKREEGWLALQLGVEKSHIPFTDEPYIHFPPLVTWKALIKARKDKYDVQSLPDDEVGRVKATAIYRILEQTIDTEKLQEKAKLKTALEYIGEKFKITILVDSESFKADLGADAPDVYEEEVNLPPVRKMVLNVALRLMLSQVGKGNATYLIRRDFIEITSTKRYLEDKVLRIYPVGDLAMPIGNAGMMMGGMQMGMQMGGMQMGMMMGGGGMPGMMMGGGGMPGMMMGGGMPGMMMGGGMPGMQMGMQMMGGTGGSFQAAFNGSLGAMGATQAGSVIDIITRLVDPGNWNKPPSMQMMGVPGMMGPGMAMGVPGALMMGVPGGMMIGGPPDPTLMQPDPQTSNSIDFFPQALALIVRAPSRMHTSITGGIVGGRAKRLEAAAFLEVDKKGRELAKQDKNPLIRVAAQMELAKNDKKPKLVPDKVWNEAFAKGGVIPGHIVATADFLFESGEFKHAAEFLKANLRHGVVVRPWVYEALAVALEASAGDAEEIRRVRLSGIALDPNDAQGFMSAARAMADRGDHERAIAFCKQAALLEPNDFHPFETALAYAENGKDTKAMEWAVSNLVSQDWPVDNLVIQANAKRRLASLATTLKSENRKTEATTLEAALARLNQRDVVVELRWENAGGPCELEMRVKEPSGNLCTTEQKQTPGGGIMLPYNLMDKEPVTQYVASQGFSGLYEINVARVYGTPLGNKARLLITTNGGTPMQKREIKTIYLNDKTPIKIDLKEGRRTELATVSAHAQHGRAKAKEEKERNAFNDLRAVASANFIGASGPRGGTSKFGGSFSSVADLAAKDSSNKAPTPIMQNAINTSGGGVQMSAQMQLSGDQRGLNMVIRPFFDNAARSARPAISLSAVPGGGN